MKGSKKNYGSDTSYFLMLKHAKFCVRMEVHLERADQEILYSSTCCTLKSSVNIIQKLGKCWRILWWQISSAFRRRWPKSSPTPLFLSTFWRSKKSSSCTSTYRARRCGQKAISGREEKAGVQQRHSSWLQPVTVMIRETVSPLKQPF